VLTEIEDNQVVSELTPNSTFYFAIAPVNILGKWVSYTQPNWLLPRTDKSCLSSGEVTTSSMQLTFSGFFAGVRSTTALLRWIRVYHVSWRRQHERRYFRTEHKHNLLFRISSINNDGRGRCWVRH
jgi:hypothetical protein